jgi:hypothetical protein
VSTACLVFNFKWNLGKAIYLFIYMLQRAKCCWWMNQVSILLFSPSLSLSLSLRLRFSPEYVCVSIAGLKKIMTRTRIWRRDRKKERPSTTTTTTTIVCSHNDFLALSLSLLSKDSRRGTHRTHSTHTHSLRLSFFCPYVYLHSNVVKRVSHFTILNVFLGVQYLCIF